MHLPVSSQRITWISRGRERENIRIHCFIEIYGVKVNMTLVSQSWFLWCPGAPSYEERRKKKNEFPLYIRKRVKLPHVVIYHSPKCPHFDRWDIYRGHFVQCSGFFFLLFFSSLLFFFFLRGIRSMKHHKGSLSFSFSLSLSLSHLLIIMGSCTTSSALTYVMSM